MELNEYNALKAFEKITEKFEHDITIAKKVREIIERAIDTDCENVRIYNKRTDEYIAIPYTDESGEDTYIQYDYHEYEDCKSHLFTRKQKIFHFLVAKVQIASMREEELKREYEKFLAACRPAATAIREHSRTIADFMQKNPLTNRFFETEIRTIL